MSPSPKAVKADQPRLVSLAKLSELVNLSTRRVQQLVVEGMPKAQRGRYDCDACAGWYIRYLQSVVEKNPRVQRGVVGTSVAIEKARNLSLDSELRELKLAEARGDLISVEDQAGLWEDAVLRARSKSLSSIDGHLDEIIEAATRPRARDAAVGLLHEFLEEVARLGDDIETEKTGSKATQKGGTGKKTEAGTSGDGSSRPRPRRKRRADEGSDTE